MVAPPPQSEALPTPPFGPVRSEKSPKLAIFKKSPLDFAPLDALTKISGAASANKATDLTLEKHK